MRSWLLVLFIMLRWGFLYRVGLSREWVQLGFGIMISFLRNTCIYLLYKHSFAFFENGTYFLLLVYLLVE